MIMVSPFGDELNDIMGDYCFILIHPPQRIPQLFIIHHSFFMHLSCNNKKAYPHKCVWMGFFYVLYTATRNFKRSLSEIMAINSELVGFPRLLWMVYPK